jgi:hypothetical protein
MLLMIAMVHVLGSHGGVEGRVVLVNGSRVRVASREHEVIGTTPETSRHGKTIVLVTSSSHDGGFGLVRVRSVVEVHALETMSQCRHVSSRMALL